MVQPPYIDLASFLAEARAIAGAQDWGDEDFHAPLEAFVAALNAEAELTDQGVARARSHIMKMLVGRLRMVADRARFPDIAAQQIRAPLVITGLGRSGTSYLNALLAADPGNLAPTHWQIWTLSPPPNHPATDTAPLIAAGERYIRFEGWQDPDVRNKHDYGNLAAAEDTLIMDFSFRSWSFPFFFNVPSYAGWLRGADMAPAYRIERQVLQALQYGASARQWVLKSPLHLSALDPLLAEFPDARMIVNHRDPARSMASNISLLHGHRKQFGNAPVVTDRAYALASMENAARSVEALIERRKDPAVDRRFVDVDYVALERDPLGQVAKVYAHHGVALSDAAKAAMRAYVDANRKAKFGAHRYAIEDSGVRVEEVRERFKFYTDHFDIPIEDAALA